MILKMALITTITCNHFMPEEISSELGYNYFEGNDRPGDVRKEGTEFVPIEWVSDINFLKIQMIDPFITIMQLLPMYNGRQLTVGSQ